MHKNVSPILSVILILAFVSMACSASAAPTPTATPVPATNTPEPTATKTPKPTNTPLPTATPNVAATQQIEELNTRLQSYLNDGYITTTDGKLFQLDDYSLDFAQINYLSDLTRVGYDNKVKNFIFRADFYWENAVKNPETSGCGIIFRLQDNGDFYSTYLSNERVVVGGYVASAGNFVQRFGASRNGEGIVSFGNPAKANFTMIVNEETMRILIDDKLIGTYIFPTKSRLLEPGSLGYFVKSGTNKDFGTRCRITNSTLWVPNQ